MALDEPRENDESFDDRGLTYLIDKELLEKAQPVKVDFVNSPMGSGFSISSSMQFGSACGSGCSC